MIDAIAPFSSPERGLIRVNQQAIDFAPSMIKG